MEVLHIAGGFAQHPLYAQLVSHLSEYLEKQLIIAPVRSAAEAATKPTGIPDTVEYELRHILRPHHRVLFRTKIRLIYKTVCRLVDPGNFDLIHAHTLYSDGAVALRLKEQFGLPYVVAFRNTDLNVFMRWRPDLSQIGRRVLQEAAQVVFLSPAYRTKLLAGLQPDLRSVVKLKSSVLPNGLDLFWLEGEARLSRTGPQLRLLYVGDASHNKNIGATLRAAELLARRSSVQLTLVGGGRAEPRMRRWLEQYDFVRHLGRIDDREELRSIYREHDIFVMPSFRETFGVVYLEALSQGLPVVHSRGQGIDGYFSPGTVSEAVDPGSPSSVAAGIEALSERLSSARPIAMEEARKFSWSQIAKAYADIYIKATAQEEAEAV